VNRSEFRLVATLVAILAIVTLAVVVVTRTAGRPYVVAGRSMEPTLNPGDRVVVDLRAYHGRSPEPGDVVLVRTADGAEIVKRVSGSNTDRRRPGEPERIWVLGDNPDASLDSREIGPVLRERIAGRVVFRYWPPARAGVIE
jgi:nickel-type superoxide dismutase maturation protease